MSNVIHKRVMKDINDGRENLKKENGILIEPEENNFYNIHFILPGPEDTPYAGGLYHGMIRLNQEHPFKPPSMYMITPSGRFVAETYPCNGAGICATFTAFHPEAWTPVQTIESILKGFISFMCDDKDATHVGAVNATDAQRKKYAQNSLNELLSDKKVKELFEDLWNEINNKTYKAINIGDLNRTCLETPKTEIKEEPKKVVSKKSVKKIESDSEEEEEPVKVAPKKVVTKKPSRRVDTDSEEEEVEVKPAKKVTKKKIIKVESSDEEEVKPVKKSTTKKAQKNCS